MGLKPCGPKKNTSLEFDTYALKNQNGKNPKRFRGKAKVNAKTMENLHVIFIYMLLYFTKLFSYMLFCLIFHTGKQCCTVVRYFGEMYVYYVNQNMLFFHWVFTVTAVFYTQEEVISTNVDYGGNLPCS